MSTLERWRVPDGPHIGVRRWGGDGPVIVLLHGLSSSSVHYEAAAPWLLAAGWTPVALDLRGHGASDRMPGTYLIDHYAADVHAFLEALAEPAVVAGHSLGGAIAVYLAGSRPDLMRAVFAEDPPLYHGMPGVFAASGYVPAFTAVRDTMAGMQAAGTNPREIRSMLLDLPGPGGARWAETVTAEAFEARIESYADCDPTVWDPAIDGLALSGWDPERSVTPPLTILRADASMAPALTPDEAARFGAANPDARIIEIEGAPHGIREHAATADRYRAELLTFLAAL